MANITTYKIKEGNHRISHAWWHYVKNYPFKKQTSFRKDFLITLHKDCLHDATKFGKDETDVHKLWGYSLGKNHHENSIRFGWRCLKNLVFVPSVYLYRNGERKFHELNRFFIMPDEEIKFTIIRKKELFRLLIEDDPIVDIHFKHKYGERRSFMLFPYVGGNPVAPHDMHLTFNEIKYEKN